MLRRSVRQRKEYLYQKALEERETASFEKKKRLREALETNKAVPTDLRGKEGVKLRKKLDLHHKDGSKAGAGDDDEVSADETAQTEQEKIDDEFAYLGVKDPKVVITTAREPSSKLMQFVKELRLLFPGAQRINRGSYVMKDLVEMAKKHECTDLVICHEHRGIPDGLIISHLPYGPTCYFGLKGVVLRHDLPEKPENMSEQAPNLIFHNFETKFGKRVATALKALFPPAANGPNANRVMTFANNRDTIHFRHYNWFPAEKNGKKDGEEEEGDGQSDGASGSKKFKQLKQNAKESDVDLKEVGPRFSLQLYRIELGTLDMKDVETEWVLRPYMNKQKDVLA